MAHRLSKTALRLGASLSVLFAATAAGAQMDINPPIPNVLLLIDTSGSMENMIDGKRPEDVNGTKCVPGTVTPMNRWASLVSVLTGTINNFSCSAVSRDGSFIPEYTIGSTPPYDQYYYLPFHRILSNKCAIGPGTVPTNYWDWPATAFKQHDISGTAVNCTSPFDQANDGLLDTFRNRVRFGMMMFDTLPDQGTGASGSGVDAASGVAGMWSYFPGWRTSGGTYAQGNLPMCATKPYEVGARNGAAPPWEGRLIPFGAYDAPLLTVQQQNDRIQQAVLAMRPYGATPLAGMLEDAKQFLLADVDNDPATNKPFGPKNDPYFTGGCRKTFVIVLSDGEPNMDMNPECSKVGGVCPYRQPEAVTYDLSTNSDLNRRVNTYVVGFGLSSAAGKDCKTLTQADLDSPTCQNATGSLAACCKLTAVAYNGGTNNAYFADDLTGLKVELSKVLGAIASGSTARTVPVFGSASSVAAAGGSGAAGYQFLSSFNAPPSGQLWTGNLERGRYVCENVSGTLTAVLKSLDPDKGDDFAANVNAADGSHPRQLFTVVGTKDGANKIWSKRSLRPATVGTDGLGNYSGTATALSEPVTFSVLLGTTPEAFDINPLTVPTACSTTLKTASAAACATRLMRWQVGLTNAPDLTETRGVATCPAGTTCSVLGSIYHATPVVVGAPKDYLRDESYSAFAQAQSLRANVLYAATTDGQLHAFKVGASDPADTFKVDSKANNELWSFMPPYVLPGMLPTYNQQSLLLDGGPVVKDVVFQRTKAQALAGFGASAAQWSTVLVAGGGSAGGFYYALDVTIPTQPKFLWQVATDATGASLFGSSVPQPGIATVTLNDGTDIKEVAVAILAGGGTSVQSGACPRQQTSWPNVKPTGSFPIRSQVRCWATSGVVGPSRSVTIVRLDTGEVLMNLKGAAADGPASLTTRTKIVALDSPMTGIPVAYPSDIGQVADRAYIGDADGTLWRIDLSSPDPANWGIEMAWDAYSMSGDTAAIGEPIQTTPIVSIDPVGNQVILFSTGDQELFTSTTPITRVWSILEKPVSGKYETSENWVIPFTNGKRVTGPISLFNGVAYFATFTPTSTGAAACSDGFGTIWGVDYIKGDGSPLYPKPQFVADPLGAPTVKTHYQDQASGTIVFGVGVTQTPTCSATATFDDPYLGNHTAVSQATGGTFQLVFQTGRTGASPNNSKTNFVSKPLPRPRESTRIDSWAGIFE